MAATADGPDFEASGSALWAEISVARPFNAAERVLVIELCRMVDRLDRLDKILSGDVESWAKIEAPYESAKTLEVVLDDAMAEARQLAQAFQRIAGSLKLPEMVADRGADGIDQLSARRIKRTG